MQMPSLKALNTEISTLTEAKSALEAQSRKFSSLGWIVGATNNALFEITIMIEERKLLAAQLRRAAKEQREGRANLLPQRSSLNRSVEGIECPANKYLS
jgi:hypothetical protein